MSIHINVGDMNYNQMSCAQRAEIDKKRKNRLAQVNRELFLHLNLLQFKETSQSLPYLLIFSHSCYFLHRSDNSQKKLLNTFA